MSRMLGPIHHWLFHKIELFEELEKCLVTEFTHQFGSAVQTIVQENERRYGAPVLGQSLEEIIQTDNIHGWLQGRITAAETRQAATLTKVFNQFGTSARTTAEEVYRKHGRDCGRDAQSNKPVDSAPYLYRALHDYILDGMPCDQVNRMTLEEPDQVKWEHAECLHRRYWEEAEADLDFFYELRKIWTEQFIHEANPAFEYQFSHDAGIFRHAIRRK